MEQCSSFGWVYYNEDEGLMGELRQYIMQSRMELEATVIAAQEEIMKKEEELQNMKDLLTLAIKEKNEAQSKLQNLTLENFLLQQQLQQKPTANCLKPSSSDHSEECSNGSPISPATQPPPLPPPVMEAVGGSHIHMSLILPEKGKFLKAVMEAGPLLQTLLLAGPLPQWQHPPPQLESIEIPPLTITTTSNSNAYSPKKKKGFDDFDCTTVSSSPKHQRVV